MLDGIEVLCHSSIRIEKNNKVIYIDPFRIDTKYRDADLIFITHGHFDHFSTQDIEKVRKKDTRIVVPKDLEEKALELDFDEEEIIDVNPGEYIDLEYLDAETIPAYNINKDYHPRENGWLGYIIQIDDIKYYIAGDTDITEENKEVKCDVAFLPVGGTYTMDCKEAAELANIINPKIAVPIHYGSIVGKKEDAEEFIKLLNSTIEGKILMK